MNDDLILYQSDDGAIHVNVHLKDETTWLTQSAMAELFGCTSENIIQHLANIYDTGELTREATAKDFLVVRSEGTRQVSRKLRHYNPDAIIADASSLFPRFVKKYMLSTINSRVGPLYFMRG